MALKFEATWSVTGSRPHWLFSILCVLLLSLLMVNDRHLLASALAAPSVGPLPDVPAALSVGPFFTTRLLLILALSSFPGPHSLWIMKLPPDSQISSGQCFAPKYTWLAGLVNSFQGHLHYYNLTYLQFKNSSSNPFHRSRSSNTHAMRGGVKRPL